MAGDGSVRVARSPRRAPWWPLALVAAVSTVVLIPVHFAVSHDRAQGSGKRDEPTREVIACIGPAADPGYCERVVRDRIARSNLTGEQRSHAESLAAPLAAAVAAVARRDERCVVEASPRPTDPPPCRLERSPPSVEDIRAVLERAGGHDAVVRGARTDDPAPSDSVIYGVPLGDACLLGHVDRQQTQWSVVGELAGGRCLPT